MREETELCKILSSLQSDKALYHNYSKIYNYLFHTIRHTSENILEIGIGTIDPSKTSSMSSWQKHCYNEYKPGNSLRAWKTYFTKAHIYGCDIDEASLVHNEERITTFHFDQTTFESSDVEGLPIMDVIIDDGLHEDNANIRTFERLVAKLRPNGYYIVEDLRDTSKLKSYTPTVPGKFQFVNFPTKGVPSDNFLWIFQKE